MAQDKKPTVSTTRPLITSLQQGYNKAKPGPPDPVVAAQQTADNIHANRQAALDTGLNRVLTDAPWIQREDLLNGLAAYHRDAMTQIPSAVRYPEAKPWVEYTLKYEQELRRRANLSTTEVALVMSLNPYLTFRGFKQAGLKRAPAPQVEKCRVAFIPDTDEGPLHIKNVDDPVAGWIPAPSLPDRRPRLDWWWDQVEWLADGTGSGLHMDNEPDDIFPLPVLTMALEHAHDTPGFVDFLRRYSPFYGGANLLVCDQQFRVVAIEKCSHNHLEVFPPAAGAFSHISGMVCRDPDSPQGRYQRQQRDAYCRLYSLPADGPDHAFWTRCVEMEHRLVSRLRELGPRPKATDVMKLFITPDAEGGLRKDAHKAHPDQGVAESTLVTVATLFDKRRSYRWQRGRDGVSWPARPEVCRFSG